jgi:hypothetical protein
MSDTPSTPASVAPAPDAAPVLDAERLDVYRVALEFQAQAALLATRCDAVIRDQLRRASLSVVLCIAEGAGQPVPCAEATHLRDRPRLGDGIGGHRGRAAGARPGEAGRVPAVPGPPGAHRADAHEAGPEPCVRALTAAYILAVLNGASAIGMQVRKDCEVLRSTPRHGTRGRLGALSTGILLLSLPRFAALAARALTAVLQHIAPGQPTAGVVPVRP